ncbi:MAG: hypothetical protein ISP42_02515, partial [Alphaproteobacteria bacterium]|nr:hypothetical protein [Alphaproteobacteria bacterium]
MEVPSAGASEDGSILHWLKVIYQDRPEAELGELATALARRIKTGAPEPAELAGRNWPDSFRQACLPPPSAGKMRQGFYICSGGAAGLGIGRKKRGNRLRLPVQKTLLIAGAGFY